MDYFDELSALFESEDAELFKPKPKKYVATPDDRLINSFNEIAQFVRDNGRTPSAEADDMQEAVLGTKLNSIRSDKHRAEILEDYDELGILELGKAPETLDELFSEDAGLFDDTEGIFSDGPGKVISRAPRPVDDRAERKPVDNFESTFKPGFIEQQKMLSEGKRRLVRYAGVTHLVIGGYYVHEGQMLRIVEEGEKKRVYDRNKERFRIIYENGTESNMYRRSLSQRLREDGYTVVDADYREVIENDEAIGRIYVLSSLSADSKIATIKNLYKIGVTTGTVENRIKNAAADPTYLMAPVKIIEDYRLTGEYNPQKVEDLIHQVFGHAKVDIQITAPDGKLYTPQEWYSVPLSAILEAVELIATGEIVDFHYDSSEQKMINN
jgi:hypothetical protein